MKQRFIRSIKSLSIAAVIVATSHMLADSAKADLVSYTTTLIGPGDTSSGTGTATFTYNTATNTYSAITGSYTGLLSASTAIQIIIGLAGYNGTLVQDISGSPSTVGSTAGTIGGTPNPSAVLYPNLQAGLYYINIPTTGYPGGEIRGQILPSSSNSAAVPEPGPMALAAVVGVLGLGGRFVSRRVRRVA